jgi:hypothetical protein
MAAMSKSSLEGAERRSSAAALLRGQRSHLLLALGNAESGQDAAFRRWYQGTCREAISTHSGVLAACHYEQHKVDIVKGRFPRLPFQYLGLYNLCLDGAEEAKGVIERIRQLHREEVVAQAPATWLYYPVSEKVGHLESSESAQLVIAFANGVAGQEGEFREWYATRHIRHALNISALVSGQCFHRTQYQNAGSMEAVFNTIAIYEESGTPEDFWAAHAALPKSTLHFPMLDLTRFSEALYRPVKAKISS